MLAPAARAETVTVGTGDLRAQIETDPWSLSFIDADGREVAGESRAMPIGYRTATGWAGATKAVSVVRDGPGGRGRRRDRGHDPARAGGR